MKKSQLAHPILAFIFDVYIAAIIASGFADTLIILLKNLSQVISIFLIVILLAVFIFLIIYHSRLKASLLFISPGEMMTGIRVREGKKVWENPYRQGRHVLFAAFLLSMVLMYSSITEDNFVVNALFLAVYGFSLVAYSEMGRGKRLWAIVPIVWYALYAAIGFVYLAGQFEFALLSLTIQNCLALALFTLFLIASRAKPEGERDENPDRVEKYSTVKLTLVLTIPIIVIITASYLLAALGQK